MRVLCYRHIKIHFELVVFVYRTQWRICTSVMEFMHDRIEEG